MTTIDGSLWRVRKTHPRRPDKPLVVTHRVIKTEKNFVRRDGKLKFPGREEGEDVTYADYQPITSCDDLEPALLRSLIRNDYIELIGEPIVTSMTLPEAKAHIVAIESVEELNELKDEESSNKNRVGVLKAIADQLAAVSEEN